MTPQNAQSLPNVGLVSGDNIALGQSLRESLYGTPTHGQVTSTSAAIDGIFFEKRQKSRGLVLCRVRKCPRCGNTIEIGSATGDRELHVHQNGKNSCLNAHRQSRKPSKNAHTATQDCPDSNSGLGPIQMEPAPVIGNGSISMYPCSGVLVLFPASVFGLYPWALHQHVSLPFSVIGIDSKGFAVRIQSIRCERTSSQANGPCRQCAWLPISADVHSIQQRAISTPREGLNYHYMNFNQLIDVLRVKNQQINDLKLKVLEQSNRIESITRQLEGLNELLSELGLCELPWLHRLLRSAHLKNLSPSDTLNRVRQAKEGKYETKGFSQKEYDIAALVLHLGGPRLLYALSKGLGLPSLSTTYRQSHYPELLPSITFPSSSEVSANIDAMFSTPGSHPAQLPLEPMHLVKRGFSLLIDEIALEERPEYFAGSDSLIGFCREHSAEIASIVSGVSNQTLKGMQSICEFLRLGKCHIAKEATVVALAPFSATDYSARVILASGTCKTESDEAHFRLIKLVIDTWNTSANGAPVYGVIWSLATDGEGRRRRAFHRYCFHSKLAQNSPLYAHLGHLPLMNLSCGPNSETSDSDYKHLEKRLASAVRRPSGILIANTYLDSSMIQHYLSKVPGVVLSDLESLFDQGDHQNVPKAHRMLSLVYEACQLNEIADASEHQPFVLLGEFLSSFFLPFTNLSLSLSEQLTLLSKCGHLLFALYCLNRSNFMTGQLYYDIQTSIKNAYFCVAKTKELDPTLPFYLLLCGDDRLESRFGTFRTMNHDSNMSLLQLSKRSAAAQHVDHIYARHPALNRPPYCLSATGSAGADHTNPKSWTGDVLVANVDLKATWVDGHNLAIHVLSRAGVNFDFNLIVTAFPDKPIDLMRPFGEYIGLQEDRIKASEHNQTSQDLETPVCTGSPAITPSKVDMTLTTEANETKPDDIKLTLSRKGWLDVEGHSVHLQSVAKVLFGRDGAQKSTDRLRRVRGYSKDPYQDTSGKWSAPTLGDDLFVGNPALTFICTGSRFAVAVIRVSAIILGTGQHAQGVTQDDLSKFSVVIKGQIMSLNNAGAGEWHWNGTWVTLNPTRKTQNDMQDIGILSVSKQAALMETKGLLIRPILGTKCDSEDCPVWCFSHAHIQDLSEELWESVKPHIGFIPQLPECNLFPYKLHNGELGFIRQHEGATISDSLKHNTQVSCYLCGQNIKLKSMRVHIAQHIVASRYSIKEIKYKFPIGELPCGFCGRSGNQSCTISRIKPGTRYETSSGCCYYVRFTIPTFAQPSAATPTTNRPIPCELCLRLSDSKEADDSKLFWSYNMPEHIAHSHPDEVTRLPLSFQRSFTISNRELSLLLPDTFSEPPPTQIEGSAIAADPPETKTPTKREQNTEGDKLKKRLRVAR